MWVNVRTMNQRQVRSQETIARVLASRSETVKLDTMKARRPMPIPLVSLGREANGPKIVRRKVGGGVAETSVIVVP